ncbi:MAG: hypothetical protein ACK5PW_13935 [Burkholderiales bacterium]|jgi:uncharacterized membrane protein YhaH (DUF805 family)
MGLLAEWIVALQGLLDSPSLVTLLGLVLLTVPIVMIARVLRRAGYSPWWVLLVLVPLVNLIALWVFAYARWPALDEAPPHG